ncbi:MAG TPA: SRPBCC domain-containing protein [Acidimicrobiales bacterium]
MTTRTHETTVEAVEGLPIVRIVREFDAPPAKVFRAHTDPELLPRWYGPHGTETRIDDWDCRPGGSWALTHVNGEHVMRVRGCFHDVRPPGDAGPAAQPASRAIGTIIQTFGLVDDPDSVAFERYTVEDLGEGRTRLTVSTLAESFEARDAIIASGMESGVREGHGRLDALLATL